MSALLSRRTSALVVSVFAAAFVWLLPGHSSAATVEYPSGNTSNFATGNGGWTSSSEYGGLCIQGLTCPALTGTWESSGGSAGAGDGFLQVDSGATTLAALLSTSTNTYRSPDFTYNGVNGAEPDEVGFSVSVNPQVAELLNLGADVNVSATIVGVSGGGDHVAIDSVSPGTTPGWKTLNGEIGASSLVVGKQYAIELSVSVGGLAAVLPSGSIGFDDVELSATGTPGGNGGNGNGNGNGSALPPPKNIPPGVAYLYRNKLFVSVKCPRAFKPRCRIHLVALTKRRGGKKLTPVRRAVPRSGRSARKVLGVRKPFRVKVRKMAKAKKRIVVRLKINSKRGRKHAIQFKRLKVVVRTKRR